MSIEISSALELLEPLISPWLYWGFHYVSFGLTQPKLPLVLRFLHHHILPHLVLSFPPLSTNTTPRWHNHILWTIDILSCSSTITHDWIILFQFFLSSEQNMNFILVLTTNRDKVIHFWTITVEGENSLMGIVVKRLLILIIAWFLNLCVGRVKSRTMFLGYIVMLSLYELLWHR
jgi:hypothetical protein